VEVFYQRKVRGNGAHGQNFCAKVSKNWQREKEKTAETFAGEFFRTKNFGKIFLNARSILRKICVNFHP